MSRSESPQDSSLFTRTREELETLQRLPKLPNPATYSQTARGRSIKFEELLRDRAAKEQEKLDSQCIWIVRFLLCIIVCNAMNMLVMASIEFAPAGVERGAFARERSQRRVWIDHLPYSRVQDSDSKKESAQHGGAHSDTTVTRSSTSSRSDSSSGGKNKFFSTYPFHTTKVRHVTTIMTVLESLWAQIGSNSNTSAVDASTDCAKGNHTCLATGILPPQHIWSLIVLKLILHLVILALCYPVWRRLCDLMPKISESAFEFTPYARHAMRTWNLDNAHLEVPYHSAMAKAQTSSRRVSPSATREQDTFEELEHTANKLVRVPRYLYHALLVQQGVLTVQEVDLHLKKCWAHAIHYYFCLILRHTLITITLYQCTLYRDSLLLLYTSLVEQDDMEWLTVERYTAADASEQLSPATRVFIATFAQPMSRWLMRNVQFNLAFIQAAIFFYLARFAFWLVVTAISYTCKFLVLTLHFCFFLASQK